MKVVILALVATLTAGCGKKDDKKTDDHAAPADGLGLTEPEHMTAQRQLVAEATQRARASGKSVLIRSTGAWCPPCQRWDALLKEHAAELKDALAGYETLALDEVFYERGMAMDHLPMDNLWYPSYYLYQPASGRWAVFAIPLTSGSGTEIFKQALTDFAKSGDLATPALATSRAEIQAKTRTGYYDPKGEAAFYAHRNASLNIALTRPAAEAHAYLAELKAAATATPEAYAGVSESDFLLQVERILVVRGEEDAQTAWKNMSAVLDVEGAVDDRSYEAGMILVRAALAHERQVNGVKGAADACPGLVDATKDVPGQTANKIRTAKLACTQLAAEAGILAKDAALKAADETAADAAYMISEKPFTALYRLRRAAGDLTGAIPFVDAKRDAYVTEYQADFAKRDDVVTKDDDAIAKAKAAGADEAAIRELEGKKAYDAESYGKMLELVERVKASYGELSELLHAGTEHPTLARKDTGVGSL